MNIAIMKGSHNFIFVLALFALVETCAAVESLSRNRRESYQTEGGAPFPRSQFSEITIVTQEGTILGNSPQEQESNEEEAESRENSRRRRESGEGLIPRPEISELRRRSGENSQEQVQTRRRNRNRHSGEQSGESSETARLGQIGERRHVNRNNVLDRVVGRRNPHTAYNWYAQPMRVDFVHRNGSMKTISQKPNVCVETFMSGQQVNSQQNIRAAVSWNLSAFSVMSIMKLVQIALTLKRLKDEKNCVKKECLMCRLINILSTTASSDTFPTGCPSDKNQRIATHLFTTGVSPLIKTIYSQDQATNGFGIYGVNPAKMTLQCISVPD